MVAGSLHALYSRLMDDDILARLGTMGDDGPGYSHDDVATLLSEYNSSVADANNYHKSSTAKIAELTKLVDTVTEDNRMLKIRNYDLISKAPATDDSDNQPTESIASIDDLFKDED